MRNLLTTEKSRYLTHLRKEMKVDERMMKYKKTSIMKVGENIQSPLVIVDSSVCQDLSTITSNSTITGEIHAKIDNRSAQSVHYNGKFHYYEIHYYERRLYIQWC